MFKYPAYRIDRIIQKLGPSVTYRQTTDTFDPVTGKSSGATNTDYNISAVVSVFDIEFPPSNKSEVMDTYYQVLISNAGITFTPTAGDVIIFGSVQYRVLKVEPGYIGQTIDSWALTLQA